jgi:hypothetical protein
MEDSLLNETGQSVDEIKYPEFEMHLNKAKNTMK